MQEPGSKIKFPGAPELNSFRKKGRIYPTFHLGRTVILAPGAIGLATTTRLVYQYMDLLLYGRSGCGKCEQPPMT